MSKFLKVILIFGGPILLLAGQAGADYVDSCVLIPDADGGFNNWVDESGCVDHYDCVNDSNAASCDGSMDSYVKTSSGEVEQYRHTTAPDTSNNLDSMAMYVEFEEDNNGTGGAWTVAFGWRVWTEGSWTYCEDEGGLDTVSVNGTECVVYRKSWTQDPCWSSSRGLGWVFFGWTYDGEADEDNIWQPCMYPVTIETGCFPACYMRCYNVWMVYYFTVTEAEGGQVIIISAADFHRPPRAYLDWREQ